MSLSVVNGRLCFCSCDVSKAKRGENPHPSTDPGKVDAGKDSRSPGRADQPAVVFGGSLSGVASANSIEAADGAQSADPSTSWNRKFAVDVLA